MSDIEEKVKQIILSHISVPPDVLTPKADLFQDVRLDSLDMVEVCMELEGTFNISDPDADLSTYSTMQKIVDFIKANKAA